MVLKTGMRWFLPLFAAAALPLEGGSQSGIPERSKTSHYVKVEAKGGATDEKGNRPITITLHISPEVTLYGRNVPRDFESMRLNVDIVEKDTRVPADMKYPVGTINDYGGDKYEVYSNKIVITGTLRRAVGREHPVEVRIRMLGNRAPTAP